MEDKSKNTDRRFNYFTKWNRKDYITSFYTTMYYVSCMVLCLAKSIFYNKMSYYNERWMRSTMNGDRLVGLVVLFIHRNETLSLILDRFADTKNGRTGQLEF